MGVRPRSPIGPFLALFAKTTSQPVQKMHELPPDTPELTRDSVERMIDKAGRNRVFARARELGWSPPFAPPLWVWAAICDEIGPAS